MGNEGIKTIIDYYNSCVIIIYIGGTQSAMAGVITYFHTY